MPSIAASVPGFEFAGWIGLLGLLGPKGLPASITIILGDAMVNPAPP